ncbi:MAG: hypothetical protein WKG01_14580 [Kofleriaceae bacterium]
MPIWFPAFAAGAAVVLAGKVIKRHLTGQLARSAVADPDGIRTVARFSRARASDELLLAVAAELTVAVGSGPLEVTEDAVRVRGVDIVRLATGPEWCSLTLTRAWTGAQLDTRALEVLGALHRALVAIGVDEVAWHARQDREFALPARHPFY